MRRLGALPSGTAETLELPRDRLELSAALPGPSKPPDEAEIGQKVLTSVAAAATTADKVATGQATPGTRAAGVAQAVLPVATAIAEASGNEQAAAVVKNTADASTAVIQIQTAGTHFAQAAQTVRDGAAPLASAPATQAMSGFGRLAAGLEITRGVMAAPQLAKQVQTVAEHPEALKNPGFSQALAGNAIAAGNGVIGVARLFNRSGIAAKLSPWAGIAADATLMAATASDIDRKGLTAPGAMEFAAYAADLAGNGLLIAGGNPVGLVLKGASLGLQAAALGVRHKDDIAEVRTSQAEARAAHVRT